MAVHELGGTISIAVAGLLTFTRSLGVVMGANIGTTVSSQVIAFDVDRYAPIALVVGFLLLVIGKSDRMKQIGAIVLGLGLIFFGLETMGDAAELDELALSPHDVVGIGDAENDHAFLRLCECAVAVENALPMLKEHADLVTTRTLSHRAGVGSSSGPSSRNDTPLRPE
jgi:hypothetical protein